MTKEELKPIDVSKYTITENGNVIKDNLKQEAEEYALNQWEGNLPWSVIQKAYFDGALPREKQIDELKAQIKVFGQNLEDTEICENSLKNRIAELEAQIEKMKCCIVSCCEGCERLPKLYEAFDKEIKEKWQKLNLNIKA